METLIEAFKLMADDTMSSLKILGYHIALFLKNFFLFCLGFSFTPIFLLLIMTIPFDILFINCAYEKLFTSEEFNTFFDLLRCTLYRFKKYGWRVLLFGLSSLLSFYILIKVSMHIGFVLKDILMPASEVFEPNKHAFTIMAENLTILMSVFLLLLPIWIVFKFFVNYIFSSLSLGHSHAIVCSFKQWKNILLIFLISLILVGLLLIPQIGILGLIIFNFVVPLKIILDIQK